MRENNKNYNKNCGKYENITKYWGQVEKQTTPTIELIEVATTTTMVAKTQLLIAEATIRRTVTATTAVG